MIGALREGAKSGVMKFILFSFLVLAVAGLVLMDVGGFFRGGPQQGALVEIDGQEIPARVFDQTVRRILSQQGIDMQTAYQMGFIEQILQSEISNAILRRAVYDQDVRVSDALVAAQVAKLVAPFVNDDMSAKEALRRILMAQNMTETDFANSIRTEMGSVLLRNALTGGTDYISQNELKDLYRFMNESRKLSYVVLPDSAIKDYQEPSDEVLLPFYQAGRERYAIPETRSFTMAILSDEVLKETLAISDEELQARYEDEIALFTLPEQRELEQSVVTNEAQAASIVEKVQGGETLKKAVQSVMGNDSAYLGTESFTQNGLPAAMAGPVFAASQGDVVGPIETALGWHVMVVKAIDEPTVTPFADVKKQLKDEAMQDMLADQMFEMAGNVDDRLASGMGIEEVAEDMGLVLRKIKAVHSDGSAAVDGKDTGLEAFENDREYLLETVFELLPDEVSPVMELSDGRYAALRLDDLNEKSYTPFEDVKATLKKLWISDQQQALNKMAAQKALQDLLAGEKELKDLGKVKTATLDRMGAAPDDLGAQAQGAFFEERAGEFMVAPAPGGMVVGHVDSVSLPDMAKVSDEEREALRVSLRQQVQGEAFITYLTALQEDHKVKINRPALEMMYGPGSDE